jgi:hypothetical protein
LKDDNTIFNTGTMEDLRERVAEISSNIKKPKLVAI